MEWLFISAASFFAGFIDSIVGGGGLILVPALFATFPQTPPATLFGTNKSASIWGTTFSALQFTRRVKLNWEILFPASIAALIGSFIGAYSATIISPDFFRKSLPIILSFLLIYTLIKKDLGQTQENIEVDKKIITIAVLIGLIIGWYDGFFGPGTGSFFIFLFVRFLKYDFLNASATAKILNVATNISAIILFAVKGHIWWKIGLIMAVFNIIGSILGTWLALKHGAKFVRYIFIFVVLALIIKTSKDAFL